MSKFEINEAGRHQATSLFGDYCSDPDCTIRADHPPHRGSYDAWAQQGDPSKYSPAPRSIAATSDELVRIIREGLDVRGSDISAAWKNERSRNIAMAIMGTWDLSEPVIR